MPGLDWHLDRLVPIDRSDVVAFEQDVERGTSELHTEAFSRQLTVAVTVPLLSSPWLLSAALSMKASIPPTSHESFAVEHGRYDTPSEPVDEEEGRGESEGEAERGGDHVERHERHDGERGQAGEDGELLGGADVAERVEMAMPTQIDQAASSGVKSSWTSRWSPSKTAEATAGWAKAATAPRKMPKIT